MIKRTVAAMIVASHALAISEESAKPAPKVERENTEWCDVWIASAASSDKLRVSKDHPEFYRDPYHYKPEAIKLQARQVSDIIGKLLAGTKH